MIVTPDLVVQEEMAALRLLFLEEEAKLHANAFHAGYPWFDVDDLQWEHDLQDICISSAKSDDSARCFVQEVQECILKQLMDVDGGWFATFTD